MGVIHKPKRMVFFVSTYQGNLIKTDSEITRFLTAEPRRKFKGIIGMGVSFTCKPNHGASSSSSPAGSIFIVKVIAPQLSCLSPRLCGECFDYHLRTFQQNRRHFNAIALYQYRIFISC